MGELACVEELEEREFVENEAPSTTLENEAPSKTLRAEFSIRDPARVKTNGRPLCSTSRLKSGMEKAQISKTREERTCGHCHEKGHYRIGCPVLKNLTQASGDKKRADKKRKNTSSNT